MRWLKYSTQISEQGHVASPQSQDPEHSSRYEAVSGFFLSSQKHVVDIHKRHLNKVLLLSTITYVVMEK